MGDSEAYHYDDSFDRGAEAAADELDQVAEDRALALDDPRHPAAPIVLDTDCPAIDSQWDDDQ